jgi:hypothetical protein
MMDKEWDENGFSGMLRGVDWVGLKYCMQTFELVKIVSNVITTCIYSRKFLQNKIPPGDLLLLALQRYFCWS